MRRENDTRTARKQNGNHYIYVVTTGDFDNREHIRRNVWRLKKKKEKLSIRKHQPNNIILISLPIIQLVRMIQVYIISIEVCEANNIKQEGESNKKITQKTSHTLINFMFIESTNIKSINHCACHDMNDKSAHKQDSFIDQELKHKAIHNKSTIFDPIARENRDFPHNRQYCVKTE